METFYVPIYSSYFGVCEGPLYNFQCQADDREHAKEQAKDSIKDDSELFTGNTVWQFGPNNQQIEV